MYLLQGNYTGYVYLLQDYSAQLVYLLQELDAICNQWLHGKRGGYTISLDKSQLREISTSVFIAKTQRGIVRPDSDEPLDVAFPPKEPGQQRQGEVPEASQKQINLIRSLLDDPRVTNQEQARLQEQLSAPIDRYTASDILDYFFGHSEKKNGRWEKVTSGVLEERKSRQPVPA